jgi:hypothetical protein
MSATTDGSTVAVTNALNAGDRIERRTAAAARRCRGVRSTLHEASAASVDAGVDRRCALIGQR